MLIDNLSGTYLLADPSIRNEVADEEGRIAMKITRWCIVGVGVGLALLVGVGIGVSARTTLRVLVNGKEVKMDVPPRLVGGRVVGPIGPIARAMGAEVEWQQDCQTVRIDTGEAYPWIQVDHGLDWGEFPYSFTALGPILTVRHHLAEIQWASLNQPAVSSEPVLARFEIIDAFNLDFTHVGEAGVTGPVLSVARDFAVITARDWEWQGFTVRAILYWVSLDLQERQPGAVIRLSRGLPLPEGAVTNSAKLQKLEQEMKAEHEQVLKSMPPEERGGMVYIDPQKDYGYSAEDGLWHGRGGSVAGAQPRQVRIETLEYRVRPQGVSHPSTTHDDYGAPTEQIFLGTSGWTIDETQTRVLSSRTVEIEGRNEVVPLYDLSVRKVKYRGRWWP